MDQNWSWASGRGGSSAGQNESRSTDAEPFPSPTPSTLDSEDGSTGIPRPARRGSGPRPPWQRGTKMEVTFSNPLARKENCLRSHSGESGGLRKRTPNWEWLRWATKGESARPPGGHQPGVESERRKIMCSSSHCMCPDPPQRRLKVPCMSRVSSPPCPRGNRTS